MLLRLELYSIACSFNAGSRWNDTKEGMFIKK
jgi:hypothetical protein